MSKRLEELEEEIDYLREGLKALADDFHYDSTAQMADTARYYLEGRTD